MRRIVFAICTTITGLVLLLSYPTSLNRTSAAAATTTDTGTGTDTGGTSGSTATDGTTTTSPDTATSDTTAPATTPPATTTATYTGTAASTRYGNVQVEITVTDGVVTSAQAVDYPNNDRHDQQINAQAIPILNQEATSAGSADISMVSGATVTSRGYIQSLQDALDQAGL